MSKLNLVQARKNRGLDTLPNDQQRAIIDLARKNRHVKKDYQRADDDQCKFGHDGQSDKSLRRSSRTSEDTCCNIS